MGGARAGEPVPIILATSNGTGMGHLSRQVAVALALRGRADPVVFSMSPALPMISSVGLRGEYCPGYHNGVLPRHDWDRYLAERLRAFVEETAAKVVVFDGVVPYRGLLRARAALPDVAFVWVRRALWRSGTNTRSLRSRTFFDLVLEPGDLASATDQGPTATLADAVGLPPVTLIEQVDPLPQEAAAAELGLDPARPAALVTVRGRTRGQRGPAAPVIQALAADPDVQIVVPQRLLATGAGGGGTPSLISLPTVFPLARYLAAFDLAVIEAGYNSVHEMLLARVPSLMIPTSVAVTDNQTARAEWAARQGVALHAAEDDPAGIAGTVKQLLDPAVRAELAERCRELPEPRGAGDAAAALLELAERFDRHRPSVAERLSRVRLIGSPIVERMLGRRLRALVRRAFGRSPDHGPARRVPVDLVRSHPADALAGGARPLVFTDELAVEDLRCGYPVEHVLAGSSARYWARREKIVRRYHDVRQ